MKIPEPVASKKNLERKTEQEINGPTPEPRIGQDVYLPTFLYISHGRDDFLGGLCKIVSIEKDILTFVEVEENPRAMYNWEYLLENQDEWREQYGRRRGMLDPDYSPESNRDDW